MLREVLGCRFTDGVKGPQHCQHHPHDAHDAGGGGPNPGQTIPAPVLLGLGRAKKATRTPEDCPMRFAPFVDPFWALLPLSGSAFLVGPLFWILFGWVALWVAPDLECPMRVACFVGMSDVGLWAPFLSWFPPALVDLKESQRENRSPAWGVILKKTNPLVAGRRGVLASRASDWDALRVILWCILPRDVRTQSLFANSCWFSELNH